MNLKKPAIFVGLWLAFELFDAALIMIGLGVQFNTVANAIGAAAVTHFLFD